MTSKIKLNFNSAIFSMMMFGWNESRAVTATSAAQGAVGLLTLAFYILYIAFRIERLYEYLNRLLDKLFFIYFRNINKLSI